jgi:hypothetical protein
MGTVEGTVLSIQMVQSTEMTTQKPTYWDDGNPKMQLCICMAGPGGGVLRFFAARSDNERSAWRAWSNAARQADPQATSFEALLGRNFMVHATTPKWNGRNNMREWTVTHTQGEDNRTRLVPDWAHIEQGVLADFVYPRTAPTAPVPVQYVPQQHQQPQPQIPPAPAGPYEDESIPF